MQNSAAGEAGIDEPRAGATIEDRGDHAAQPAVIAPIGGSAYDIGFHDSNCQRGGGDRQRVQFRGEYSAGREDATETP